MYTSFSPSASYYTTSEGDKLPLFNTPTPFYPYNYSYSSYPSYTTSSYTPSPYSYSDGNVERYRPIMGAPSTKHTVKDKPCGYAQTGQSRFNEGWIQNCFTNEYGMQECHWTHAMYPGKVFMQPLKCKEDKISIMQGYDVQSDTTNDVFGNSVRTKHIIPQVSTITNYGPPRPVGKPVAFSSQEDVERQSIQDAIDAEEGRQKYYNSVYGYGYPYHSRSLHRTRSRSHRHGGSNKPKVNKKKKIGGGNSKKSSTKKTQSTKQTKKKSMVVLKMNS